MKILYLTHSQIGDRSFGGAIRANAIRDALTSLADVDTLIIHGGPVFTAEDDWQPQRVRHATVSRYGTSPTALNERHRLRQWIAQIVAADQYDFIVAQYLDLAALVPPSLRSRMIFDPDDFRKTPLRNASVPARAKLAMRNMLARRVARQALHVWFANPAADQLPPTSRRSFLPNIIVPPDPSRTRPAEMPDRLLMVGLFAHKPNVDGLTWFHDEVLPEVVRTRPHVELHVVGRGDQALQDRLPRAIFHGFVDDLTAEYDRAALVVAPILSGGGTQIKVIDALAHGRPVLASTFAHSGFAADLIGDKHLLVAGTASEWIERCCWALVHRDETNAIARSGEAVVRDKYGPDQLRQLIGQTIAQLVDERSTSRG